MIFLHDNSYVGRLFVKSSGKPVEILTKLNEMAGYAPDEEINLYEVCSFFTLVSIVVVPFQLLFSNRQCYVLSKSYHGHLLKLGKVPFDLDCVIYNKSTKHDCLPFM